jgi:hypothetical protein
MQQNSTTGQSFYRASILVLGFSMAFFLFACSSSNFPQFSRNLNNGEAFGMSDSIEIAEQTIYYGGEYPSRLVLPVLGVD